MKRRRQRVDKKNKATLSPPAAVVPTVSRSCAVVAMMVFKGNEEWQPYRHQPSVSIWIQHAKLRDALESVRAECLHIASTVRLTFQGYYDAEEYYYEYISPLLMHCEDFINLRSPQLPEVKRKQTPTGFKALACTCRVVYCASLPTKIRSVFTWGEAQQAIQETAMMYETLVTFVSFLKMSITSSWKEIDIFSHLFAQLKVTMQIVCGSNFIYSARPSIVNYLHIGDGTTDRISKTMTLSRNQITGKEYGCLVQSLIIKDDDDNDECCCSDADVVEEENLESIGPLYKRLRQAAF